MKRSLIAALIAATFSLQGASYTAYIVPAGTIGNQVLPAWQTSSMGNDFDVNSPIKITSLGVFDSGSDGLVCTLHARIFDRDTRVSLADLIFTPDSPGTLVGGSRFKDLANPLTLPAGFHAVISVAYLGDPLEPDGNNRVSPGPWTTDSAGGVLSFVGYGRHSWMGTGDVYPDNVDSDPWPSQPTANNFAAGTFTFEPVPEPSTTFLLLAGCAAALVRRFRKA